MLVNFLNNDDKFPKISLHHLFPKVFNQATGMKNHLNKVVNECIENSTSAESYIKEQLNRKVDNFTNHYICFQYLIIIEYNF